MKGRKLYKQMFSIMLIVAALIFISACNHNNSVKSDKADVLEAKAALNIGFTVTSDTLTAVTGNLILPTVGLNGVQITWISSKESTVSNSGIVTRGDYDNQVLLTATLTKNDAIDSKEFQVTVLKKNEISENENLLIEAKDALMPIFTNESDTLNKVTQNLTLPGVGLNGVMIVWTSNNNSVISNSGVVTRPEVDTVVTLTASLIKGGLRENKIFELTVVKADITVEFAHTDLDPVYVQLGEKVLKPSNPIKDGYVFDNWYKDESFNEVFDFETPIVEKTTIYANYYLNIAKAKEIGGALVSGEISADYHYVKGKIISIDNVQYGNMTIMDGTDSLYVYGVWSKDGTVRYDSLESRPVVGDIVYLYGPLKKYGDEVELNNSRLIRFSKDEDEKPFDITDYTAVSINRARDLEEGSKVIIEGVVARINYANGMVPAGLYLVDDTNSIYIYDSNIAASIDVGDLIKVAGSRENFVLFSEQNYASLHGYQGAIQLNSANLLETLSKDNVIPMDWIPTSTIKDIINTDYTVDNITSTIFKVTAFINEVPGLGFTNFYFTDLDNETGSYVYSLNNGNDFTYLRVYDGQLRTVYLSVINAKSTAAGILYRFMPIGIGETVEYNHDYDPEYAVKYVGLDQFQKEYVESPNQELIEQVNNERLNIVQVSLTYESSNSNVVYFERINGILVFKTGESGSAVITITGISGEYTYSEEITVKVIEQHTVIPLTVSQAIAVGEGTEVTLKGIVAASLVNQSGFYLIDETGIVAVRASALEIDKVSIGNEVIITGLKTHSRGTYTAEESVGQLVIDQAVVVYNLFGNHDYSTLSFRNDKILADLVGLSLLEEHSIQAYILEAKIDYYATPYYAIYSLMDPTDENIRITLYSSNEHQLSFLEPYKAQTVTVEFTLVNWNGKDYRGSIISIIVDGIKIPSNQNFK